MLVLVDELSDGEKLARAASFRHSAPASYSDVLRSLLERGGTGMKCLVAYHVGELRLESLLPALESLASDRTGFVAQAVDRASERIRVGAATG